MVRQCLAPGEQPILPWTSEKVWITLYEFDSTLLAADLEYPEAARVRTAVFGSQATSHWNLKPIGFQEGKMSGFGGAVNGQHFRAVFKDHYEPHA